MTPDLIAMLGGSLGGFIMKFMATQMQQQAKLFEQMLQAQQMADESADKAANRGGTWMRRGITFFVMFAIVIVPTVVAFTDIGVSIQQETKGFLGLFKGVKWETVNGFVILPEVRQAALAIIGFYFGSSQVR